MDMLNSNDINNIRTRLARECRIPAASILLNHNGWFEIHNVNESDKNMIINALRNDILVSDVSYHSTGYNFNRISYLGMPEQRYCIQGMVDEKNQDLDDDISQVLY